MNRIFVKELHALSFNASGTSIKANSFLKYLLQFLLGTSSLLCKFIAQCTKYTVFNVGKFKPPRFNSDINSEDISSSSSSAFTSIYLCVKNPPRNTTFCFKMSLARTHGTYISELIFSMES